MRSYTEREILAEAIAVIDEYGRVSTTDLISLLRERMNPEGTDLEKLKNRADDKFSQKVRNLVSHKTLEKYSLKSEDENGDNVFYSNNIVKAPGDIVDKGIQKILKNKEQNARKFTAKFVDYTKVQIENQEVGSLGESFVYDLIGKKLSSGDKIEHTSKVRGDGAGYDIFVFKQNGTYEYIEVKTTKREKETPFYMSVNEYAFYKEHINNYVLARVSYFDKDKQEGEVDYYNGVELETYFDFETSTYRVKLI